MMLLFLSRLSAHSTSVIGNSTAPTATATGLVSTASKAKSIVRFVSQNPLVIQQQLRQYHHYPSYYYYNNNFNTIQNHDTIMTTILSRWNTNFARLYARRMLELTAASLLIQHQSSATTQMQAKAIHAKVDMPTDWLDWEKHDYDLQSALGTSTLKRLYMSACRILNLSILATPLVLLTPISYVSDTAHAWLWDYALFAIEAAGPTFIKFIQWATTRQDLFSQEFCTHFGTLRDHTKGHDWKETERLLSQELGPDWKTLFEIHTNPNALDQHSKTLTHRHASHPSSPPKPIGSGCIAQVYKATLLQDTPFHPKGTELAIKVQHPNIMSKVCIDFYLLGKVAQFLEAIPGLNLDYLSIRDTVDQFCNVMLPQLDLRLEAKNLNRFIRDFESDAQVTFPTPLDELTTPKVLTETYCHGTPILEYQSADLATRKELAYLGLSTTLKMIFLNDFIHGDLHPGNILVSRNAQNQLMLTLLDCGLVIEFGPSQHETVVKILGAFTRRQGREAAQLMVDTASKCQASPLDVERFIHGIEKIIIEDSQQNFVEHIGDYITDICYLACRHKVKLEAAFINAGLSVEIIEGIASSLYPDIQVVSTAMPLVMKAEMMHRLPFSWSKYRTD